MNRYRHLRKSGLAIALLCGGGLVFAQESPPSSGNYPQDLARVVAYISSIRWTAELCAENYPETKAANQTAVEAWRRKYQPFISEMMKKYDALPAYAAARFDLERFYPEQVARIRREP